MASSRAPNDVPRTVSCSQICLHLRLSILKLFFVDIKVVTYPFLAQQVRKCSSTPQAKSEGKVVPRRRTGVPALYYRNTGKWMLGRQTWQVLAGNTKGGSSYGHESKADPAPPDSLLAARSPSAGRIGLGRRDAPWVGSGDRLGQELRGRLAALALVKGSRRRVVLAETPDPTGNEPAGAEAQQRRVGTESREEGDPL